MTDAQIVAVIGIAGTVVSGVAGGIGVKILSILADRKQVDVRVSREALEAADIMIMRLREGVDRAEARAEKAEERAARVEEALSALKRESDGPDTPR